MQGFDRKYYPKVWRFSTRTVGLTLNIIKPLVPLHRNLDRHFMPGESGTAHLYIYKIVLYSKKEPHITMRFPGPPEEVYILTQLTNPYLRPEKCPDLLRLLFVAIAM